MGIPRLVRHNIYTETAPRSSLWYLNTLRLRQDGRPFKDDIFKSIFFNENIHILIKISLRFVPKAPINNIPALVETMAWSRPDDKPLSEPMMVSLLTHICVTRPQWVVIESVERCRFDSFQCLQSSYLDNFFHLNQYDHIMPHLLKPCCVQYHVFIVVIFKCKNDETHDDVIKWKHFPRNWPFVQGIHRSPVNSPHKGQWRRALIFSLICAWINCVDWVNNREAGDLRCYRAHYDVIVM